MPPAPALPERQPSPLVHGALAGLLDAICAAPSARGWGSSPIASFRAERGVRVVGVNAGHAFSFVRDAAEELRWAAVPAEGSGCAWAS